MKYKLILLFLILMLPMISSMQTFKQRDNIDLKIQCIINGTYCSNVASCNINVLYQNNSILVNNGTMTYSGSYFNYTIPTSYTIGDYKCSTTCCQSGLCGTTLSGEPSSCDFEITPTGNVKTNSLWVFTVLVVLSILVLILAIVMQNEYLGFISGGLFIVSGVYSMIYGIGNVSDTWTQAVSYVLLGLGLIFEIAAGYSVISGLGLFKMGVDPNEF